MPNDKNDIRAYGNPYTRAAEATDAYMDVRPSYPREAIALVMEGLPPAAQVLDIGAGTGKLTAALIAHAQAHAHAHALPETDKPKIWALEPSDDMRAAFAQELPNFPADHLVAGRAEQVPLPPNSIDLITYGQSWHWLDQAQAAAEASRLLRPHGRVAILVNQLAVEVPWVHRLTRIMRSGDVVRPSDTPALGSEFTRPELCTFDWEDSLTPEQIVSLGTTRASWIRASESQREKMRANLLWYLYEHLSFQPNVPVKLPYHTYVWTASDLL